MPVIEILKRDGVAFNFDRKYGVIADIPDEDGEYEMATGDKVEVEMSPLESELGVIAIALISDYFLKDPKKRDLKDLSSRRRVIHLNKKTKSGSVRLNFAENLVVTLKE